MHHRVLTYICGSSATGFQKQLLPVIFKSSFENHAVILWRSWCPKDCSCLISGFSLMFCVQRFSQIFLILMKPHRPAVPGKRILNYSSKSSGWGVLSVAPLPGAESYCKGYQNKDLFPAMLLLSRLGRRCNKTQTLQRFLGTAQDWQLKVDLRTS